MVYCTLFVLSLLLVTTKANGQRTMRSQNLISAEFRTPFTGATDLGGELSWGQYLLNSYWQVSLNGCTHGKLLSTSDRLEYLQALVSGQYMYRLVGTRSRSVSLYGGGGVFLGYEFYDPWGKIPTNLDIGIGSGTFLYGVLAKVELEIFLTKRLAVILSGQTPINFSSPLGWIRWQVGAGVRVNI